MCEKVFRIFYETFCCDRKRIAVRFLRCPLMVAFCFLTVRRKNFLAKLVWRNSFFETKSFRVILMLQVFNEGSHRLWFVFYQFEPEHFSVNNFCVSNSSEKLYFLDRFSWILKSDLIQIYRVSLFDIFIGFCVFLLLLFQILIKFQQRVVSNLLVIPYKIVLLQTFEILKIRLFRIGFSNKQMSQHCVRRLLIWPATFCSKFFH